MRRGSSVVERLLEEQSVDSSILSRGTRDGGISVAAAQGSVAALAPVRIRYTSL